MGRPPGAPPGPCGGCHDLDKQLPTLPDAISYSTTAADFTISVGDSVWIAEPRDSTPGTPAAPATPDRWVRISNGEPCPDG